MQQAQLRELTGEHIRALLSAYQREALAGPPGLRDDVLGSRRIARVADELKQRGFYVDIADDGSLRPAVSAALKAMCSSCEPFAGLATAAA